MDTELFSGQWSIHEQASVFVSDDSCLPHLSSSVWQQIHMLSQLLLLAA